MHILVDGHNLIGQVPGMSLADPDDEAKLVMLLRRYTTAKRGRRALVIFDRGVYGHPLKLDGYGVTCQFARSPQDADAQLIKTIATLKRGEWSVVSSDRRVADAARARGLRTFDGRTFAAMILPPGRKAKAPDEKPEVPLSAAQIAEWRQILDLPEDDREADEERQH